jgi:chromosome segregation ATPase
MISKCENVVINRVKFSEFEGYDPTSESTDGLKLVGYIETDAGKRNISVDYGKILKKNGEIPGRGIIINAEAIDSSSIISNNTVCEQVTGFKVDANDLEFIQINGLSEKNYIKDGYLPISFANSSYTIGQECALFLHNIPANICIYTPVLSVENAIYNEIKTTELAGHTVNALIIFTKVKHSSYGEVMMPTRVFVAEDDKSFHVYAPTIAKNEESSPVARMLPASNANLDALAMRVSDLEERSLSIGDIEKDIAAANTRIDETNTKIDDSVTEINKRIDTEIGKVTGSEGALAELQESLEDEIKKVKENLEQAAGNAAADLVKILHVKKFSSKDELNNWISELDADVKVKELSRTIALIRQENDTYEEYVCVNPDQADGNPLEWDRLGAVDSIYATHETMGSVQLVHDVTEGTIDTYIDTNIAGDIFPKKGLAVAPIALKDLYNKHNANVSSINDALAAIEETKNAVEVINKELEIKTNTDESTSSRIDTVDATIEHLKNVIGLNGCHGDSCNHHKGSACATHGCEDLTGKCTLLCRVDENERDISNISETLNREITRLDNAIDSTIRDIAETVGTYTDEKVAEAAALIAQNNAHIAENDAKIAENDAKIADIQVNYVHNNTLAELVDIIGLNGCHKNESCSTHHCEDVSDKCTILCRIDENERDISSLNQDVINLDKVIDDLTDPDNGIKAQINATAEYVDGKFEEIQSKFSACESELERLTDSTTTNKENITELETETRRIAAEIVTLKDADTEFEAEISRLDSDINKQITSISAIEAGIADIRSIVESNAATNTATHTDIIARLGQLESNYTSDKTFKEIVQTDMVYATQAYNEVLLLKSTVEGLKEIVNNNSSAVTDIKNRITTAENLVNDCNEKAGFAITTASNASEKATLAETKAENASKDSSEAVRTAELAKETSEQIVEEVQDLIKNIQSIHTVLLSFKNGSPSGEFTIKCSEDFTAFDSAYYNFVIIETRSNEQVIYPSVEFSGSIDSNKADGREIKVTTERKDEPTLITVLAYRAEQHVVEK